MLLSTPLGALIFTEKTQKNSPHKSAGPSVRRDRAPFLPPDLPPIHKLSHEIKRPASDERFP